MMLSIPILVREYAGLARLDEPVSVSVPLAVGKAEVSSQWRLSDPTGKPVACQTRVLAAWPNGSIKWLQCKFLASSAPGESSIYQLHPGGHDVASELSATPARLTVEQSLPPNVRGFGDLNIDIGVGCFSCGTHERSILDFFGTGNDLKVKLELLLFDHSMRQHNAVVNSLAVEPQGPLTATLSLHGAFGAGSRLRFRVQFSFYAGSSFARVAVTLENPSRARHTGGYWDLGDPGSVIFQGLRLLARRRPDDGQTYWTDGVTAGSSKLQDQLVIIQQDSSGGENDKSRNHSDDRGHVNVCFQGFRVSHGGQSSAGMRANPVAYVMSDEGGLGIAPVEFWQKFPSCVIADEVGVHWLPFIHETNELQPGEQSTHVAWLDFAPVDDVGPCQRLAWAHVPLEVRCAPQVYSESGAVPYLPDEHTPPRSELATLLLDALEGPRNFFAKREVVDEYGWRNYGDTWADHEEVHYPGPHKPIISHYNNQFDILHGFLVEYLRSGDRRWWELADPLARHVMDIDIYHTDRDKAAYNGGLFWPTTHYYDAGTSTHRSMAREMSQAGTTGVGGGPGSEHNFTSGLLLYHYLTGDQRARESVIGLADWVIAMDDGEQHLLGLLSGNRTGIATLTSAPGYDSPGRGAANSITALKDGYLATGNEKYLDKAEELIHRTIHPRDDVAARGLDNAELHWPYTMYLQALVRFLEVVARPQPPSGQDGARDRSGIARYIQQSVLHYARWMAEHEQFVLDHPERLQYPTETWAAQELRKGNVLLMAARLTNGKEADTFAQRGKYFLDRAWESLLSFPTRDYTRPLALVLSQGYIESALQSGTTPLPQFHIPDGPIEPSEPQVFISQKEHIRRSIKSPRGLACMALRAASPARWARVLRRTWLAERLRMAIRCNPPYRPADEA